MMNKPELSIVIPVFNAESTLECVVERIRKILGESSYEIVLVDDGSSDNSADLARNLVDTQPNQIHFIQLSRNFGEHNTVLAGLAFSRGEYVAILDDDGQNPPEEIPRMLAQLIREGQDVLYGRYIERKHAWYRQLGSWFNDKTANLLLSKPRGLYLSSFKILNRFLVDEVLKYRGPYPYLDGLICRATNRIGQVEVPHHVRLAGRSGYTFRKLLHLWLNMFLGFSILPLRISIYLGYVALSASVVLLFFILADKWWLNQSLRDATPLVLASISLFSSVQLIAIGTVGEYVGRMFLASNGQPLYIVRFSTLEESKRA